MSKISLHTRFEREKNKGFLLSAIGQRLENILACRHADPYMQKALEIAQIAKHIHDIADRTVSLMTLPPAPYDFENNGAPLGARPVDVNIIYFGRMPRMDLMQYAMQMTQTAQLNLNHEIRRAKNKMDAGCTAHKINEPVVAGLRTVSADLFLHSADAVEERGFTHLAQDFRNLSNLIAETATSHVDLKAHGRNLRQLVPQ